MRASPLGLASINRSAIGESERFVIKYTTRPQAKASEKEVNAKHRSDHNASPWSAVIREISNRRRGEQRNSVEIELGEKQQTAEHP